MSKSKREFSSALHGEISSTQSEQNGITNTVRENFVEKLRQVMRKQFQRNHLIVAKGNC
jgi:hypothetical protein